MSQLRVEYIVVQRMAQLFLWPSRLNQLYVVAIVIVIVAKLGARHSRRHRVVSRLPFSPSEIFSCGKLFELGFPEDDDGDGDADGSVYVCVVSRDL